MNLGIYYLAKKQEYLTPWIKRLTERGAEIRGIEKCENHQNFPRYFAKVSCPENLDLETVRNLLSGIDAIEKIVNRGKLQ